MGADRNLIPFQLGDEPTPETDAAPTFEDIGVRPLGHVESLRGVELVAVKGDHSETEPHDMTPVGWVLHTFITPPRGGLRVDGGREMTLPRFTFLPPEAPIQWRSAPCIATVCLFGADFISALAESEPKLGFDSLDCVLTPQSRRLAYLAQSALREAVAPGFGAALMAEAIAMEITLEVIRIDRSARAGEPSLRGGIPAWQMKRLEAYVHDNLSQDLSVPDLAAVLGMSPRHLLRAIRRDKGVGVHRWIADLRLADARRLLTYSKLPLHEIARRAAFKSAAAFSAAFHAACGLSPSEYRRLTLG